MKIKVISDWWINLHHPDTEQTLFKWSFKVTLHYKLEPMGIILAHAHRLYSLISGLILIYI